MTSGAGLVTIATPVSAEAAVAARVIPEVITAALAETDRGTVSDNSIDYLELLSGKATAIAAGPGLTSEDDRTRSFIRHLMERRRVPMVLDADALNAISPWQSESGRTNKHPLVLTPHPGEMLRLLGSTDNSSLTDRVSVARDFAVSNAVILVLKGSRSLVAAPDGRVFINPTGNPGLGTAGAGDTLTGIIGGFLAQSFAALGPEADALTATVAALHVGGLAGDIAAQKIGMRTMVASDIRAHLGDAILALDPEGEIPDARTGVCGK
jgi:NAD(P)H-hydrate epimerase